MRRWWRTVAGVLLVIVSWPAQLSAETSKIPSTMSLWTGISASEDSAYVYSGTAYSLSRDIDADGLVARIGLGGGWYRTDGNNAHDVDHYDTDLMLGYRTDIDGNVITLYGGVDINQHNNLDPDSDIRGTKLGMKVQAELYAPVYEAIYISAFANFSTAFDTFNATFKAAYRMTSVLALGPEIAALGTQGFDQTRTGLAAAYWITEDTELAASAGYAWAMDKDSNGGIYGGINLYTKF